MTSRPRRLPLLWLHGAESTHCSDTDTTHRRGSTWVLLAATLLIRVTREAALPRLLLSLIAN